MIQLIDHNLRKSMLAGLKPTERLSIEAHAKKHYHLPSDAPFPGPFDISKTPYLRKILECLQFDNEFEEVVFKKGCQIGGTSVSIAFLLWIAEGGHSKPALVCFPTEKNTNRFVKKKFRPAVKGCASLTNKMKELGNNLERESLEVFNGPTTTISFGYSRAPNTLRMDSCAVVIFDEVSDFPPETGQGDPVKIGVGRTSAFEGRKKIYSVSTPANEGCRISKAYQDTCKQKFHVPCPECKEYQTIEWKQIKWKLNGKDVSDVYLECIHCKGKIKEHHKTKMFAQGEWRPTDPDKISKKKIGFHLSALYSPLGLKSWKTVIEDFLDSKDDPMLLKVWVNNNLGEEWKTGVGVSKNNLKKRIKDFTYNPLPKEVGLITCGIDINESFSAIEFVGWGKNKRSWGLGYHKIHLNSTDPKLWIEIEKKVRQTFTHPNGNKLRILGTCIDSGYATDHVYDFVKKLMGSGSNVIAVKGYEGKGKPVISTKPSYKNKGNIPLFLVSNDTSNELLYSWLNVRDPDSAGYCSFPRFYKKTDYLDELTAMKRVDEVKRGKLVQRWDQETGKRCEANDCRRYAIAALYHLSILGVELNNLVEKVTEGRV